MAQGIDRERWRRIDAILESALTLPLEARAAHVDEACAGDDELRRHVEELLAADRAAGSFLAAGAFARVRAEVPGGVAEPELDGPLERTVGAYRLVDALGEGGMGTVYLAERVDGHFAQQVAVKLLKQGLVGEDARRRFLQERQILARLEHPGIARLLDGGVSEAGTPFFVMERVAGRAVTVYCDDERLGVDQRLRVFLEICAAVQYAHRNLVVHRDLKPSNILVDAAGRVKLLDFGIAKLLAQEDGGPPAQATRTALRAMTPEYAAPEQVSGDAMTTATDVYSLGVLLYELLAGQRPYLVGRGSVSELQRAILEQEPPRPSSRADAGPGLPGVGAKALRRRLRGDLDDIVLKALEKVPERRYPSAEALASDIGRHLDGLPVSARGDRLAYRGFKLVRRHRRGAAVVALVLLSLVGGLIGTAWQARRATGEARKAAAVKDFLKSLFSASDPAEARGKERTARQLLDDGAARLETELKSQPDVQSEVALLIANLYLDLGDHQRSLALHQAELERRRRRDGPRSLAVAESLYFLARALYAQGRYPDARVSYREALDIRAERGDRSGPQVAELLQALGEVTTRVGDLGGGAQLLQRALALSIDTEGADSRAAADVRCSLALAYAQSGRLAEAVALDREAAAWLERHDGRDHPDTLTVRYNLASHLLRLGSYAEAATILEDVVPRQRRVLGPQHGALSLSLRVLAAALNRGGRAEDALPRMAEALAIDRSRFGSQHVRVAHDLGVQAMIQMRTGGLPAAERDVREGLGIVLGLESTVPDDVADMRLYAGSVLAEAGHLEQAESQIEQALPTLRAAGTDLLGRALDRLGDIARRRGQTARAVSVGQEARTVLERTLGHDHPVTVAAWATTGAALMAAGRDAEGEPLLRASIAWLERSFPQGHFDLASARLLLGEALLRSGRRAEARPLIESALEWRQIRLGPADPRTRAARRALDAAIS